MQWKPRLDWGDPALRRVIRLMLRASPGWRGGV